MNSRDSNQIIQNDLETIALEKLPWNHLSGKSILVTGGGGFLASYLVKSLIIANNIHNLDINIICVVRDYSGVERRLQDFFKAPNFMLFLHDLAQPLPINFPAADYIIHCASQASPKYYGTDPVGTLKVNSAGTIYLLEHAVKHKCERFLFFSSGEVYGELLNDSETITVVNGWKNRFNVFEEEHLRSGNAVNSYDFIKELSDHLRAGDVIVTDMGTSFTCTMQSLRNTGANRLFTSSSCCSMGFGLPGAIGACFADRSRRVICIAGDGGFQMNIQELQTVVHHRLPIKIFILNSNGYLAISLMQDNLFDSQYFGSNQKSGISSPDFPGSPWPTA